MDGRQLVFGLDAAAGWVLAGSDFGYQLIGQLAVQGNGCVRVQHGLLSGNV
jgi:hypothetical protein